MTTLVVTGMTIHAAGYDRQSSAADNRSEASPVTQRAANRGEAERRARGGEDVVWVGHYSEKPGTSAFSGVDRPELNRLLADCRAGRVNMIIVHYISRLYRSDPLDAIPVCTEILGLGVTIVSLTEGEFHKGNLMDLIHLIMRLDQAHNESKNKSTAVKSAHDLARTLGGVVGKAGYGFKMAPETRYTNDGKPVVVQVWQHHKTQAKVIREIVATIRKHEHDTIKGGRGNYHPGSLTGICTALTTRNVRTRGADTGKRTKNSVWAPATLKRILRDPRIAGFQAETIFRQNENGDKTRSVAGYRIVRDPITMAPLKLECGPIIDPADWHWLQAWLDGRGRGKGLSRGQSLLTAMERLYCECGAVMVGHSRANKRHYECKRPQEIPGQHTGGCTIDQPKLDTYVAARIFALISTAEDDEDTQAVLWEATRRFGKAVEAPEKAGERASLVAERADAANALNELYEDRAAGSYAGSIGRKHFLKAEATLSFKLAGAEERLNALAEADNPRLPIAEWLPEDPNTSPIGPGSWWHSADIGARRELVKLFVERVTVSKTRADRRAPDAAERVTIKWAEPDEDSAPERL